MTPLVLITARPVVGSAVVPPTMGPKGGLTSLTVGIAADGAAAFAVTVPNSASPLYSFTTRTSPPCTKLSKVARHLAP